MAVFRKLNGKGIHFRKVVSQISVSGRGLFTPEKYPGHGKSLCYTACAERNRTEGRRAATGLLAREEEALKTRADAIAIDGQAAAGKTVVGRELARRLGCPFLDTGIMYRAITWLALQQSVSMDDEAGLGHLARQTDLRLSDLEGRSIVLNDRELNTELRSAQVDQHVSLVARVSGVRRELVRHQRDIANRSCQDSGGIVMVGRDIGTIVLPDADLKVFMVASPEVRARRRYDELVSQGQDANYDEVLANAVSRDQIDSQREDSPLSRAPDALLVNTDDLTINQVVESILERLRSKSKRAGQASP